MQRPRIAILGGGVVGLACAIECLQRGGSVTVLDDDSNGLAASWGNAGHIATEQCAPLASPSALRSAWGRRFGAGGALHLPASALPHWLPFSLRFLAAARPRRFAAGTQALAALLANALPAWQRLAATLGDPGLVRADGHFVLWESERTAVAGAAGWRAAPTGTASARAATPDELAVLRGLVKAPVAGAIRFEGSGQVRDLDALRAALIARVQALGGRIVREPATLGMEGGRAQVPGHPSDLVLVAAGVRSGDILRPTGHRVPIIAERGYHVRARADHWPTGWPPLVFEDRSMIVTAFDGVVQAASFLEFNDWRAPADERKWQRLEAHVAALGLPLRGPFTRWMGSRPTLPDYLPAIGRSRRASNLHYAFGHQHLGLTLAAVTAACVGRQIAGEPGSIDLSPFDLARF